MLFFKFASSQDVSFEWVKTFKGTGYKSGLSILVDANKSTITVGEFFDTTDFDPGPNVYLLHPSFRYYFRRSIFISKLDSSGNFLWAKQIDDSKIYSITKDLSGDIYLYGSLVSGNSDLDPGTGVFTFGNDSSTNYILKLDENGNFIWAKPIPHNVTGGTSEDVPLGFTSDVSNNIIITGNFIGIKDFDPGPDTFLLSSSIQGTSNTGYPIYSEDLFILKLDTDGNFIWAKQLRSLGPNLGNDPYSVKADLLQNIFISGAFENTVDFDPGPGINNLISNGKQDIFVTKFDKDGNFIWAKQMGAESIDIGASLELDNFGNVYTTGLFGGSVDFDPGFGTYYLSSPGTFFNAFISKLDNNGNFIFAKQFVNYTNNVRGSCLALDKNNNIYITGPFSSTVDFDPGPAQFNINSGGLENAFIAKLKDNGDFIWAMAFLHNPNCCSVVPQSIKIDASNNIYTTGSFNGTIDFDPNATIFTDHTLNDATDAFVHKLKQCKSSYNSLTIKSCASYTINSITYDSSGLYYQSIPNAAGCDSIITLNISITNNPVQTKAIACSSYFWNGNTLNNSGVYKDTLTAISGCDSIVVLNLTINKTAFTIINEKICPGKSYAGYTTNGSFIDTLVTSTGCDSIRVLNLEVLNNPTPNLGKDTNTCVGKPIQLTPGLFQNYLWSTGEASQKITISKPGIYWVQVTDKNNCTVSDSITLKLSDNCSQLAIPNAFTPNGDGINDVFRPTINMEIVNYVFTIYNRWGKKVFETTDYTKGWNGNINGVRQTTGNYIYIISFLGNANKPFLEKGNFILLK